MGYRGQFQSRRIAEKAFAERRKRMYHVRLTLTQGIHTIITRCIVSFYVRATKDVSTFHVLYLSFLSPFSGAANVC